VVLSLLSHCRDLLGSDIHTASRSRALFEAIRRYIEEQHASALTRESVAQAFYISPNYLSHLFQNRQRGVQRISDANASGTRASAAERLRSQNQRYRRHLRIYGQQLLLPSLSQHTERSPPNIVASITAS
jgi:AraC-like DNA-binding protein